MTVNELNYPPDLIERVLRGIGASPAISFRYDLLDAKGVKIGVLDSVESGSVSYGESQGIKRTARRRLRPSRIHAAARCSDDRARQVATR